MIAATLADPPAYRVTVGGQVSNLVDTFGTGNPPAGLVWVAPPPPVVPPDPHRIMTISDDGTGVALYTTQAPHGLTGAEFLDISDTTGGVYDGTNLTISSVPNPWSFQIDLSSFSSLSFFGTWAIHV